VDSAAVRRMGVNFFDLARSDVTYAIEEALRKHGPCTSDPVRGALNLAEEVGEVAKEALDATRHARLDGQPDPVSLYLMIQELAQAAGYAILLMASMRALLELQGGKEVTDGKSDSSSGGAVGE
jgi:hypothetical protein